jgi:L-alanine-DL-glutamate epimerase-like enolase superfamily enzyme
MKIIDLKCAIVAGTPLVRIDTDEGINGLAQIESTKNYIKPHVLFYKRFLVGEDPTNIERILLKIHRLGGFKPWGSAVSAIEMALWDIIGKITGLPVYKLLGGKIRERVLVYNTLTGVSLDEEAKGFTPEDYAQMAKKKKSHPFGFKIFKFPIGFHGGKYGKVPDSFYGEIWEGPPHPLRGHPTEKGIRYTIECVRALRDVLGEEVGLALDCGPGFSVPGAIKLAKSLEEYNILWLEDLITGDYYPYTEVKAYHFGRSRSPIPIHTGEQIYSRYGFKYLIEKQAVDIIGPDPCDVGGLAETSFIARFAEMYQVLIAPHSGLNGPIFLNATIHLAASLPLNFIALECPFAPNKAWWNGELVKGMPVIKNGYVEVPDNPGFGIELKEHVAYKYIEPDEEDFFTSKGR